LSTCYKPNSEFDSIPKSTSATPHNLPSLENSKSPPPHSPAPSSSQSHSLSQSFPLPTPLHSIQKVIQSSHFSIHKTGSDQMWLYLEVLCMHSLIGHCVLCSQSDIQSRMTHRRRNCRTESGIASRIQCFVDMPFGQ